MKIALNSIWKNITACSTWNECRSLELTAQRTRSVSHDLNQTEHCALLKKRGQNKKIENMDAHWKRGKDADNVGKWKTERFKSKWNRDELILTNSISHWECVSSWDLPVKRMIVAIAPVCYRTNNLSRLNLGKLDTTENPKMSSFIYRRFHNIKNDLVLCIAVAIP